MTTADPHPHTEPYDVLALGASAGGHAAVAAVLQALPPDFAVPIVVMQHLAPDAQGTVDMYRRLVPYAVEPLLPHSRLAPGTLLICPPRTFVDLLPDGTFALAPNARGAVDKPIDRLLASLARSFGHRAIGVILTGMGADGALGARELHLAGGRIIVQNEASAEFPDMPRAAIGAGAADLVVPLQDIGQVIASLATKAPWPPSPARSTGPRPNWAPCATGRRPSAASSAWPWIHPTRWHSGWAKAPP
jgi:chemotaxis response regulator CheB